ncbi:TPA: Fic family protein [Streptococcus suis]
MDYKELKIIKYQQYDQVEAEYHKRLNSIGTIRTDLYPYLMQRGQFKTKQYPLFVVPLLDIQLLIQKINENSIQIRNISSLLPKVAHQHFYREQLYKAVINTNEIEGIKTTRKEVSDAFQALKQEQNQKIRLLSTVRMYHDITENDFLQIDSLTIIRQIYNQLTEGEVSPDDQLDGDLFRNHSVSIVDNQTGKIEHIAPSSEEQIILMLQSWIQFINNRSLPFLIKATVAHYFFENIHPFYDGNGRTGRYILSRYLARKLDVFTGLVLSQKIYEQRSKYYKAFAMTGDSNNYAEATFFVKMLLEMIEEGQRDIIQLLEEKQGLLDQSWNALEGNDDYTILQKQIIFLLLQSTIFVANPKEGLKDNELIQILRPDFSKKKIQEAIISLRKLGLIQQLSLKPSIHRLISIEF